MHSTSLYETTLRVLKSYKLYAAVFVLWNVVLLARIPLGTFNDSSALDAIAHFVLPATGTPLLYMTIERARLLPVLAVNAKLPIMVSLGIAMAVLWEIFEFIVDRVFATDWQLSNADTMTDLILGAFGTLLGCIAFLRYYHYRRDHK